MFIKPMVRNNICLNSHPKGCAAVVEQQIAYVKQHLTPSVESPKLALVIGCSTGYGLASRIAAGFGYRAATIGVSLEKPGSKTKPGTPGYYNNMAFERAAAKASLPAKTLDGDAFSNETKAAVIEATQSIAALLSIPPKIDLLVYSLASPVRIDPNTGVMYRSVIKPIGTEYSGKTLDIMTEKLKIVSAEPASPEEIDSTIKVMGGEDWNLWIDALDKADVLSPSVRTVAYTYIGPELSWPIYKNGTIGRAKEDLERTSNAINARLSSNGGAAWVSVNKAVVTRASAVIPIIPFYVSCLFKVMKDKGIHEGCIEQITRLYKNRLYFPISSVRVDNERRIRLDDWEMREDVQAEVIARMKRVTDETVPTDTDLVGFKHDFFEAHGFDVSGVDYDADIDPATIEEELV
ncbi:MAG: trans-2-enoyl-CoA reductase family protein [Treponema sp.]|jgi:enoyl-[acyl-carrier protein] reductase/trans-2-enoyl-CoA reductase (NAD+)|nr:trans-2-enoyl-CoA reductase family protein [Treponema sp.]